MCMNINFKGSSLSYVHVGMEKLLQCYAHSFTQTFGAGHTVASLRYCIRQLNYYCDICILINLPGCFWRLTLLTLRTYWPFSSKRKKNINPLLTRLWSKDLRRQLNVTELVLLYRTTVRITLKGKRLSNSIIWDTVTTATLHKGAELQGNWSLRPISPAFLLYTHITGYAIRTPKCQEEHAPS